MTDKLHKQLAEAHSIVTDALGFELKVRVEIGKYEFRGEHKTYESSETGKVAADALHTIKLSASIAQDEILEVIAHECYHLFYSVRHLITVDEETEAEVFGQLCKRVNAILATGDAVKANGGWLQHAAWAWRRAGMDGWALGHIKPTKENCHVTDEEFSKFEIHELVFADSQPLPQPPEQV